MATFNIPVIDYGGEASSIALPVADAVGDAALTALFNALDGVSMGNFAQSTLNLSTPKDNGGGGSSADPWATRKLKWLARYHDGTTGKKYDLEIPTPDMTLLTGNTDFADIATALSAGNDFKLAFDGFVKARVTGNAVVLDSLELRGRDLKSKIA